MFGVAWILQQPRVLSAAIGHLAAIVFAKSRKLISCFFFWCLWLEWNSLTFEGVSCFIQELTVCLEVWRKRRREGGEGKERRGEES